MQAGQNIHVNGHTRFEDPSLPSSDLGGEATEGKPKGGLKLRPITAIVWRNLPLILGVTTVMGGLAYMGYRSTPLIYQGDFTLLVEPITSQARATDPTAISRAEVTQTGDTIDYPTLLQVLQSPELLSKIADKIKTRYPNVSADSLARDLKNQDLTVARIGTNLLDSTRAIGVTYKGTDRDQVEFVLSQLAMGYLRYSLEDRTSRIGGGVKFIEDQLPGLQQRVNNLESQIQAIRQRYRFTDPTIENEQVVDQLRDVRQKKLEAETQLQEQATLYGSLRNQLKLSPEQGLATVSLSQNPRYQDLLTQLKKVESQIAVSLARFNEESPVVQRLREQQRNLNRLLSQEAIAILGQSSPNVPQTATVFAYQDQLRVGLITQLVSTANQTKALQARTNEILRTEGELDRRLVELPAIVRQYNSLQQQLDIATKTLNQFLLQRETLRVEAAQKEVPWEYLSKPQLISSPLTGKPIATRGKKSTQLLMGGVGAGLLLGLLAALLREKLRNVFVTARDLQDAIQLPFLGVIPKAGKELDSAANGKMGALSSPFLDAFSSLYMNLRFLGTNMAIHSLAIGSVEPGDGKTTVALNLAKMAASMGQRVLLVDANLFSPRIHLLLDLSNQRGLTDVLRQKLDTDTVIQPSPLDENLFVLTAGPVQIDSTKLFASTEMQRLARRLEGMFDLVIYDTPALEGLTDVNFLTAQTNGLLMVVGVKKTQRSRFNANLEELKKYRLPVVGVVANHTTSSGYAAYPTGAQANAQEMPSAFLGKLKEPSDAH